MVVDKWHKLLINRCLSQLEQVFFAGAEVARSVVGQSDSSRIDRGKKPVMERNSKQKPIKEFMGLVIFTYMNG